jgi:4-hydroxy-tetrahydrodipicolinate synthase
MGRQRAMLSVGGMRVPKHVKHSAPQFSACAAIAARAPGDQPIAIDSDPPGGILGGPMFKGSIVALVTPMTDAGEVDPHAFAALIERHLAEGTDGIVVGGTTGEAPTLSPDELEWLVREGHRLLRGRIPLIAGTGTYNTRTSIARTERACAAGADACLIVTPYYNKPTQDGLFAHFSAIADASTRPLILYNIPSRTACDLLPETVARLAAHLRIVGIKEGASRGAERARLLRAQCGAAFAILSGEDATALEVLLAGGDGVISVTANVAPRAMRELVALARAGDEAGARRIDERLRPVHAAMFLESNPIPVKWALQLQGLIGPGIRLPLTALSEHHHTAVRAALASAGLQ